MPRRSRAKRRALPWIALLLSVVATAWLIIARREDLSALRQVSLVSILVLTLLQIAFIVVQSGRYHAVIVKCAETRVPFFAWLRLFLIAQVLNLFVPQAGNVYRGFELKRAFGVSLTRYVAAYVNAPWIAMVLYFTLGAAVVGVIGQDIVIAGLPLAVLLGVAAIVMAVAPFAGRAMLMVLPQRYRPIAWLRRRLGEVLSVTMTSVRDPAYVSRMLLWTLASFVLGVALFWVGFGAVRIEVGLAPVVAYFVVLQLTTFVMITPGNLGVRELAFGVLAASLGAAVFEGVLVSALLRATKYIALLAFSLPMGGVQAIRAARRTVDDAAVQEPAEP